MNYSTEKIFLNQVVEQKVEKFCAEDNIIIPDIKPDILSSVGSNGNIYVYKKELINGKIKIDGGVQVDVVYLADDEQNSVRAIHSVIDFSKSFEIDNVDDECTFSCNLVVRNIEPQILNGRKLNVKVNIEAQISISSNKEKELIMEVEDCDDVQMVSNIITINSVKGLGETIATVKDSIQVNDNLADILSSSISVRNKEIKISYNKVLSKADVMVEVLYLNEEEQIKSEEICMPLMGFIDLPGISDDEICDINYEMRNLIIKPNSVEDHAISIEAEFVISCKAYEEREFNIIQDLYSPQDEIILNQENINIMQSKKCFRDEFEVNEKINIPEIKDNQIYSINVSTEIIKTNILNNSISFECEMTVTTMYLSNISGRADVKVQKISFSHAASCEGISKNSVVNAAIELEDKDFSCSTEGIMDLNIAMSFNINTFVNTPISIISGLKTENTPAVNNNSSLVIYFVKEGDTLWNIAKRFKSTVDAIVEINNIENQNKINIGDQLFIPRYANSKL